MLRFKELREIIHQAPVVITMKGVVLVINGNWEVFYKPYERKMFIRNERTREYYQFP